MTKVGGRHVEAPTAVELPELALLDAAGVAALAAHGDYEAIHLADADLAGRNLDGAAFLLCRLDRCGLDGASLRRGRVAESLLTEAHATSVDAADAAWRSVILDGLRIGALLAPGITWDSVRLRGGKLDFVNLSGAKLTDVAFDGCVIGELELAQVQAKGLRFEGAVIEVLDVTGARLADVDLRGATLGTIRGIDGLRGVTVSPEQLLDLAPLLAAHVGLRVRAARHDDERTFGAGQ